jgi:hypothetical protein
MRTDKAIMHDIETSIAADYMCENLDCMSCPHYRMDNREAFIKSFQILTELLLDIRRQLKKKG